MFLERRLEGLGILLLLRLSLGTISPKRAPVQSQKLSNDSPLKLQIEPQLRRQGQEERDSLASSLANLIFAGMRAVCCIGAIVPALLRPPDPNAEVVRFLRRAAAAAAAYIFGFERGIFLVLGFDSEGGFHEAFLD